MPLLHDHTIVFRFTGLYEELYALAEDHVRRLAHGKMSSSECGKLLERFKTRWRQGAFCPAIHEALIRERRRISAKEYNPIAWNFLKPLKKLTGNPKLLYLELRSFYGPQAFTRLHQKTLKALRDLVLSRLPEDESFPTEIRIDFRKTIRMPDGDPLYIRFGFNDCFIMEPVDDFPELVPLSWLKHGGVMLPVHPDEAMWISLLGDDYPFAVKVASGKINAVSGRLWSDGLTKKPQDYLVFPKQTRLHGFVTGKGEIRQFVATPPKQGRTLEEQLTKQFKVGGVQLQVYPMKPGPYYEREVLPRLKGSLKDLIKILDAKDAEDSKIDAERLDDGRPMLYCSSGGRAESDMKFDMGLGIGERVKQVVHKDPYKFADWDQSKTARVFVHLCNPSAWTTITGSPPPPAIGCSVEDEEPEHPWVTLLESENGALPGGKRLATARSFIARRRRG